jgi:hypothetical protein
MARRFLAGTLLDTARNPGLGVAGFFGQSPNAAVFDDYVERNGQTYQQVWDSDVTTVVGAVDAWVAGGYLLYEPETNNLIGAEYYNPDRGWLPWTMCRVGG